MASTSASPILRGAFALEAALNILFGSYTVFAPHSALSSLGAHPALITPTAEVVCQSLGALVFAITVPLLMGLRDEGTASERKMTYLLLGAGEAFLVPLFVGKWLVGSDAGSRACVEALVLGVETAVVWWGQERRKNGLICMGRDFFLGSIS